MNTTYTGKTPFYPSIEVFREAFPRVKDLAIRARGFDDQNKPFCVVRFDGQTVGILLPSGTDPHCAAEVLEVEDFRDECVFVVACDDPKIWKVCPPDCLEYCQTADGPIFVVCGAEVTNERIARLVFKRPNLGITAAQIQKVRDSQKSKKMEAKNEH